jgi:HlyD family secretion protein
MGSNWRYRRTLGAYVVLALCGCDNASATGRQPLQGVVELDTRTLSFEVPGRVEEVRVQEGDAIDGTVVLARLDESMARPERDARAAEVEAAKAQLALLEAGARNEEVRAIEAELRALESQLVVLARQRARQNVLTSQGAAPSARLDDLDAQESALVGRRDVAQQKLKGLRAGARRQEIDAARARVAALEASLVAVDARLERFVLRYQGDADVLEVHVKQGEVVAAGSPALTLADQDHPYVDVFVPQSELANVRVGFSMNVRVDSLTYPLKGRVERVGYKTEFTPRYLFSEKERANLVIRVRVRLDDPKHVLHAGVPAFAFLTEAEK